MAAAMLRLVTALLVVAQGVTSPKDTRPAPARAGLSWAESDSLGRKLEAIERRPKAAQAQTILVSQGELNSYLNLGLGPRMPQELADLDIRLEEDRFTAQALVDLDKLKGRIPPVRGFNPVAFLGGRVPVEVEGRLASADGFGSVELDKVRLGGFPIPPSLLEQMVQAATRTPENPAGFEILAPFRLPYSVKRVRLQPGRALLEL